MRALRSSSSWVCESHLQMVNVVLVARAIDHQGLGENITDVPAAEALRSMEISRMMKSINIVIPASVVSHH